MKTKLSLNVLACIYTIAIFNQISFAQNWKWQNPLPQGNSLSAIAFVDTKTGWAVGALGTILHTVDGGVTWTIQNSGTKVNLARVIFNNKSTGWSFGGSTLLHTTDGGKNWQSISPLEPNANYTALCFRFQ